MEWQHSHEGLQRTQTRKAVVISKWKRTEQYCQMLYDKRSHDKRQFWRSSLAKVCFQWDQVHKKETAFLGHMQREAERCEATKMQFAECRLQQLKSELNHMKQGWQALQQFKKYAQGCIRFARTSKESLLSLAIERNRHMDNMATPAREHAHTERDANAKQPMKRKPESNEKPVNKRPRRPHEPEHSTAFDHTISITPPTNAIPTDSIMLCGDIEHVHHVHADNSTPMDTTDEGLTDAIWLCGEGK